MTAKNLARTSLVKLYFWKKNPFSINWKLKLRRTTSLGLGDT
uniref:Uncharacterized protein n=1 Tax=Anguilla anguilla TaxID=7936 RepID=A0A0E9VK91_ANGAN